MEIIEQPSRNRDPVGKVTRVLPQGGSADTAIDLAIASHGLPHEFQAGVMREARKYGREVDSAGRAGRVDLRELPLITIDGEDARDFDDAVWAQESAGGYRLIVAIADVSHYVRTGMELDAEARERATSVYFPNRVLPMLPEPLSNHLCSLMPKVDRLCMVCDMQVTKTGRVSSSSFHAAVMRSAARLTYTQAAAMLEGRDPKARRECRRYCRRSNACSTSTRPCGAGARRAGRSTSRRLRSRCSLTSAGSVTDIREYPRNDAHRLIEECMIAANVEAARFLKKHKLPALFRIHGRPEEDRIQDLKRFLALRGVHLDIEGELEPARLQKALKLIADTA